MSFSILALSVKKTQPLIWRVFYFNNITASVQNKLPARQIPFKIKLVEKKGVPPMNETIKTIATRYSCRDFKDQAIEKEKIDAIALAAVQAPSGMNQQPWKISVLNNKAVIDAMDQTLMNSLASQEDRTLYDRMMSRGGKVFYNAPLMYVIAKLPGKDLDCGIVCENMALAASSLGLGNVICGLAALVINDEIGKEYKEKLIPEGYEFGVALLVGYAVDAEGTPHELDLSKIVYVE